MRYSARVRGTARLKIARYIKENADEGREEVGREEEGGQGEKGPGDGMACKRVACGRERARRAGAQTLWTVRLAGAQCAGATWRRRGVETHHDTAVPDGASPARFEGCCEAGRERESEA